MAEKKQFVDMVGGVGRIIYLSDDNICEIFYGKEASLGPTFMRCKNLEISTTKGMSMRASPYRSDIFFSEKVDCDTVRRDGKKQYGRVECRTIVKRKKKKYKPRLPFILPPRSMRR